jgi:leucyl aminopeptidase
MHVIKVSFMTPAEGDQKDPKAESGVLVVGIHSRELDEFQKTVDFLTGEQVKRVISGSEFKMESGSIVTIPHPSGLKAKSLVLVALKDEDVKQSPEELVLHWEKLGGKIWSSLGKSPYKSATVYMPHRVGEKAAHVANGLLLKSWSFDKYHTTKEAKDFCHIKTVSIITDFKDQAAALFDPLEKVAGGIFLTRELVSEPPNVIYPESMAQKALELQKLGVEVEILGEEELKKLGFNALLGVGQGSARESRVIVLQWKGGAKEEAPVAFVGKGVTFDTGGISIKPSQDMDDMKWDMAGSAAVLGLIKALASRKAKVNAVGVMGMVENMPDGNAQRPGDIVTSLSGQTIEILNTDAEGRLVLADALWYTQDRFKPKAMINLATLTGAIVVSLGTHRVGLFSNDDKLAAQLTEAGLVTDEKLWRMPLDEPYDKEIDSVVADVRNLGAGKGGGSITAAQFLQRFVNKVKWAHLDIAGTAWDKKGKSLSQAGATAMGVRLLNEWVKKQCES